MNLTVKIICNKQNADRTPFKGKKDKDTPAGSNDFN